MKIVSSITIWLLALLTFTIIFYTPKNVFALSVPFQNTIVGANSSISANYNFGRPPNQHGSILCFENTPQQNIGTVNWTLNGQNRSSAFPVTLVTKNSIFQGQAADSSGTISISNNSNIALVTNCIFAF